MNQSFTLFSNTGENVNLTSVPVRADNWYGRPGGGLYTVAITTANFIGRIFIEATLVAKPVDADWFPIQLNGSDYLMYPTSGIPIATLLAAYSEQGGEAPEFLPYPTIVPIYGESGLKGFTFRGNYTWLRARLDRSGLVPGIMLPNQMSFYGSIDSIQLMF